MAGKPVHNKEPVNIGYAFNIMLLLFYIFILLKPMNNNGTDICSFFYNSNDLLIGKDVNEATACIQKSDRQQLNMYEAEKTLKYLKINDKVRMPITNYRFIIVNCVLFGFLSINRVNISNENTVANGKV